MENIVAGWPPVDDTALSFQSNKFNYDCHSISLGNIMLSYLESSNQF